MPAVPPWSHGNWNASCAVLGRHGGTAKGIQVITAAQSRWTERAGLYRRFAYMCGPMDPYICVKQPSYFSGQDVGRD